MTFLRYFLFTLIGFGVVGMLLFLFLLVLSAIWLSKSRDFANNIMFKDYENYKIKKGIDENGRRRQTISNKQPGRAKGVSEEDN